MTTMEIPIVPLSGADDPLAPSPARHPEVALDRPTLRTPLLDELRAELAPLLRQVAAGALGRELDGRLPANEVRLLADAGFGALRVRPAYGGRGATLPELTQLWVDLATADANLPQALRGHDSPLLLA